MRRSFLFISSTQLKSVQKYCKITEIYYMYNTFTIVPRLSRVMTFCIFLMLYYLNGTKYHFYLLLYVLYKVFSKEV